MNRLVASSILVLLMATPALCETSIWVARTDSSVTYIGGTIHLLRASDRPFPPEFDTVYGASDILVFEVDLADVATPEFQRALLSKASYTDGRTLDQVLSAEAYRKLKEYCDENGIPLASMNQMKPGMVALSLVALELMKLGVDQEGIDLYYHGKATADDKTIQGLETIEEQIDLVTAMGDGNESAFILYNLDEMHKMGDMFDKMVAAWKTGDMDTLDDMFLEEMQQEFPKLYDMMIVERNSDWIPRIEEYLTTPATEFVLVGTAHLVGEDGVIEQLRELGYEVEQLK